MYDELTAVDIQKMQKEINYRVRELRPQLIEEVQTARAFGDSARIMNINAPNRRKTAMTAASAIWNG